MLQTVKQLIEGGVKQLSPSFYWHAKTKRVGRRIENINPEFSILLSLCDEEQIAIDIGAARGEMTLLLLEHSQACYAFEPCRAHSVFLRRHFRDYRKPVFIEEVALSDSTGDAELRQFRHLPGQSTIEPDNTRIDREIEATHIVPKRRLDDYGLRNISCIKIDVEGHEEAVIRGAMSLLQREHPSLLVEIEERFRPNALATVFQLLATIGYRGFFVLDNKLVSVDRFDKKLYQPLDSIGGRTKTALYINDFLFVAPAHLHRINHLMHR